MNLLFVVPDKDKDLGNLEFGGPEQASREDKNASGGRKLLFSGGTSCFRMCSVRMILKS